jgi:hypothetical protein
MTNDPLTLIACPEPSCGALAEIEDQFELWSTDGDIAFAKTQCLRDHGFTVPVDGLTYLMRDVTRTRAVPGGYRVPD